MDSGDEGEKIIEKPTIHRKRKILVRHVGSRVTLGPTNSEDLDQEKTLSSSWQEEYF